MHQEHGKHKEATSKMTYSQKKRAKMANYREVYFSHNPGLFGCIWFCAYCGKPIVGKRNVEVDHITPLNNPLGMNNRFNLVSACRTCNRNKSDKADYRVVEGYLMKMVHSILFAAQNVVVVSTVGICLVMQKTLKAALYLFTFPFKQGSWLMAGVAVIIYAGILFYLL